MICHALKGSLFLALISVTLVQAHCYLSCVLDEVETDNNYNESTLPFTCLPVSIIGFVQTLSLSLSLFDTVFFYIHTQ